MRPLLLVLLALLVLTTPAHAAGPTLGVADDRLLFAGGREADQLVNEWAETGIEQVRILALWSRIAGPSPEAPKQWGELDGAIGRVAGAGLEPILTITGPGPLWSS